VRGAAAEAASEGTERLKRQPEGPRFTRGNPDDRVPRESRLPKQVLPNRMRMGRDRVYAFHDSGADVALSPETLSPRPAQDDGLWSANRRDALHKVDRPEPLLGFKVLCPTRRRAANRRQGLSASTASTPVTPLTRSRKVRATPVWSVIELDGHPTHAP